MLLRPRRSPGARGVAAVERALDGPVREEVARSGVPGAAVSVRWGEAFLSRTYGTSGGGAALCADALFQVLSLSKAVTAMCALALVERGLLALDEPVWTRLRSWTLSEARAGGFDPQGVTLRRLLAHASGFNLQGWGWRAAGEAPTSLDLLRREDDPTLTLRLVAEPGSGLRYSGGAYVVVQRLLEEASGRAFPDLAREVVLRPLGMDGSDFDPPPALLARLATAHDERGVPLPPRRAAATAASALHTTADDLVRLWSALAPGPVGEPAGRGVVTPRSIREMLSPQARGADGSTAGLGVYVSKRRGVRRASHWGFFAGWYGQAEALVERRVALVALTNGDRGRDCVPEVLRLLRRAIR